MTKLSVNINKVATLRNARGGNNPDVVKVALDCEAFGAEGITVHPRPDERHIRRSDVYELRPLLTTEFNIEGYPSPEFVDLVLKVKPHQVTLVPDAPDQITSNAGWDTKTNLSFLTELIREILDIKNVKVLESVRKTLVHAKKEMESVSTMVAEDEEPYMTKSEIMDGLSEACKDIKLMREGKLKGRPIEELLNEL